MRTIPPILLAAFALAIPTRGEAAPPATNPDGNVIRVTAFYPGASARVVADVVAAPIEQQINGVEGMTGIESESRADGHYELTVRFGPKTDLDVAQILVQNRVALATPVLPEMVRRLGIAVRKLPDGPPTLWLALTSPGDARDATYLTNLARQLLKDELTRLPGVADVRVIGPGNPGLLVWLDPEKLAAREMTVADLVRALDKQNVQVAAGQTGQPKGTPLHYTVTAPGRLKNPADLGGVAIKTRDGLVVRLRDVARIELGVKESGFAEMDGRPAALVAITPWRGKLTAEQLRKAVAGFAKVPEGVRVELVADLSAGGIALVKVQLPDSASQERTQDATAQASRGICDLPGGPRYAAFAEDREPNVATILVKLPGGNRTTIADVRKLLRDRREALYRVKEVTAGGDHLPIRIAVCDVESLGERALRTATDAVTKRLAADPTVMDVEVVPGPLTSRIRISLDRSKLKDSGVSAADVADVIRTAAGARVHDSGPLGSNLVIHVVPGVGVTPADLAAIKLRDAKGEIVPLNAVATIQLVDVEQVVARVNLYPALILTAYPAVGTLPADAAARWLKLLETNLPKGYRAEMLIGPGR